MHRLHHLPFSDSDYEAFKSDDLVIETPIDAIINAAMLLENFKLDMHKIAQAKAIMYLDSYFKTKTIDTAFMVAVFNLSAERSSVDREDIARYFRCNPVVLYKFEENFKALIKRGYLETSPRYRSGRENRRVYYQVTDRVYNAILENKPIEQVESKKKTDPVEILMEMGEMIENRDRNDMPTQHLAKALHEFLQNNTHSPLCTTIANLDLKDFEKIWFTAMVDLNLRGRLNVKVDRLGYSVFHRAIERVHFNNTLQKGSSSLIADKWLEFTSGGHISEARVKLTEKAQKTLEPLGIKISLAEMGKATMLLKPEDIVKKELFYNPAEDQQITSVRNYLKYKNHKNIIIRLQQQGMRTGICTLLYGVPGTGKTESVYQIAKETGRAIWKVDLTDLKSMWYGESQKKVKELFENYKSLCQGQKRMPILLLNEADAILGTRQANTENTSQSTDNAIQNIFLDCLEDFEGILFATTNLEKSLDPAFERRFLFKIEFNRPEAKAQQQIWKSKLQELTKSQAEKLSEKFDLSGGEIENVLRKLSMLHILEEEVNVFDTLKELCETEKIGLKQSNTAIGFK
ncbi:MAG TPA: ATP-binding protein [Flavobacteriaceae bacterium]|nr:ATP-binding protein [Flavobacteriaceae bacterium]